MPLGWLDADGLEELRVTKWQLDQLPDPRELLAHPADVIVADVVEPLSPRPLALDGVALEEDLRVWGDDAVLDAGGADVQDLELDAPHAAAHEEEVALADGAIRVGDTLPLEQQRCRR
jgi:hypothetical protein